MGIFRAFVVISPSSTDSQWWPVGSWEPIAYFYELRAAFVRLHPKKWLTQLLKDHNELQTTKVEYWMQMHHADIIFAVLMVWGFAFVSLHGKCGITGGLGKESSLGMLMPACDRSLFADVRKNALSLFALHMSPFDLTSVSCGMEAIAPSNNDVCSKTYTYGDSRYRLMFWAFSTKYPIQTFS